MAAMTTTQLWRDCTSVFVNPTDAADDDDDDADDDDDPCARVEISTPATMDPKLVTSLLLRVSIFQATATTALVNGSAALTVSTNAAELDKKPLFVARNPMAKQMPARTRLEETKSLMIEDSLRLWLWLWC